MEDLENKIRDQLLKELKKSNKRIAELEKSEVERKQVEKELKYNEQFLNDTFDSIQDGISILDKELSIIRTNRWMERMYSDQMPLIHKKCYKVYQRRNSRCPWCPSIKTLKDGKLHREVVPYPDEDNPAGWIELSAYPFMDKTGKMQGVIEHVKDITKRKQAEKLLQDSEEKFRILFNGINDAVFVHLYTKEGFDNFIEVNDVACKRHGYTKEEFLDLSPKDISSPVDVKKRGSQKGRTNLLKKGKIIFEAEQITKKGERFPVEISSNIIKLKDREVILSVVRDITERKQAEEKIRKLSTAVMQSPSVIAITDIKGNLEYVNPKFTELTGYTSEEAIGQNPKILKSSELSDKLYKELWDTISSGKEWRGEFHNKKKNGKFFWEAASVSPIFDKLGKIINYIKVAEDITRRKQAEEELAKYREHLEELVKERTAELEEKNIELKRYNKLFEGREIRIKELRDKVKELEGKKLSS